jgi:hypothetical protein
MDMTTVCLGIELSEDRAHTSIVAAGAAGAAVLVELVAYLTGTATTVATVTEIQDSVTVTATVIDARSGAATLIRPLVDAGITVTEPTASDLAVAHGLFLDAVNAGQLRHVADPRLDEAARFGTQRRLSGAAAWDRHGAVVDVAPLSAATLAHWAHVMLQPQPFFAALR